jgi:hypothetical protein
MSIDGVQRELLVRYLDTWVAAVLHGARRATFAQAWAGPADADAAEAALRVFVEFADQMRGRRITIVQVAASLDEVERRRPALPKDLELYTAAGEPAAVLPAALQAARAGGAPLLVHLDADNPPPLRPLATGKPSELLLATSPEAGDRRPDLNKAGFPLVCGVDLVAADATRRIFFGTGQMKHVEVFKEAVWALDEYAGVHLRDPQDAEGRLMDISLRPSLGPLRDEILAHLGGAGERTVTEIRQFALTATVYRVADVTGALTSLLTAGALTREPEHGRLAGDTVIRLA